GDGQGLAEGLGALSPRGGVEAVGAVYRHPQQPGLSVLLRGECGGAGEIPEKDLLVQVLRVAAVPRPGEGQALAHVRVTPDDSLRAVSVLSWVHVISSVHPKHPAGGQNVARYVKKYFTTSEDLV